MANSYDLIITFNIQFRLARRPQGLVNFKYKVVLIQMLNISLIDNKCIRKQKGNLRFQVDFGNLFISGRFLDLTFGDFNLDPSSKTDFVSISYH